MKTTEDLRKLIKELNINSENLRLKIENTILKPYTTVSEIENFCEESVKYKLGIIAINSGWVSVAKRITVNSNTKICCGIGFPLGATSIFCKTAEIKDAICAGAEEVDFVVNISRVKSHDYTYVKKEIEELVKSAEGRTTKAILETCYLTKEEKIKICEFAMDAGVNYVKTSTGFGDGGATIEDIILMKNTVKNVCKVKASGGIRNLEDALVLIQHGADRLGTSSGIKIMDEYKSLTGEN